jgi:hypothetical protein
MATEPIPVKAADLRRTDVAWHREAERFAVVSSVSAVPGTEEVQVTFLSEDEEVARQRYQAQEEVPLKRRGVNAERVIKAFCVPLGEKASAWRSERRADCTFHAGFVLVGDGYEFVGALGAWDNGGHIRLLPDGGQFPYSFSLADDLGRSIIDYCEGDIGVRVFDEFEAYVRALDIYARGEVTSPKRLAEHERAVSRALRTGTFPGSVEFEGPR